MGHHDDAYAHDEEKKRKAHRDQLEYDLREKLCDKLRTFNVDELETILSVVKKPSSYATLFSFLKKV